MRKRRPLHLLLVGCVAMSALWAGSDPFVGKWKLNPSKSRITDEMNVEPLGTNKYALTFSGTDPETVVADGTDQPAVFGTTLAITVESPNTWKVVRKKDGHMLISAIWKLSEDGKTLTDAFTGYDAKGSASRWTMSTRDWREPPALQERGKTPHKTRTPPSSSTSNRGR